jgi:cytochrome P450
MTISEVLLDPAVYDKPLSFIPERWLDLDEASLRHLNSNFVAFGRGTRACQGQG